MWLFGRKPKPTPTKSAVDDILADVQPILQEISRLSDMPRKIESRRAALERVWENRPSIVIGS